jgi:hypothetical protein
VYAHLTLETVALNTLNNVAVFVTDATAKCAPVVYPFSILDKGTTECTQMEEHSV